MVGTTQGTFEMLAAPLTEGADCRMRFQLVGACLRVWAEGTSSFAATVACWQQVIEQVRTLAPRSVLLLDELRGRDLTAAEWESLVQATRGQGLERVRIAHVKPQGTDELEYCEIHAREVGLDARVFADEASALLWLREAT